MDDATAYRTAAGPRMDDAVRSLRIATTLVARLRELAATEAQQVDLEIWHHLDVARAHLAAIDRNVAAFDGLRAAELSRRAHASFDDNSVRRASDACDALMRLLPEIDWDALARGEDLEIAAVGSLATRKWRGAAMAIIAGACAIVAGVMIYRAVSGGDEPVPEHGAVAKQEAVVQNVQKLDELRARYRTTCDRGALSALVDELHAQGRDREADDVARASCTAPRPSCAKVGDEIAARVASQLHLARDRTWKLRCDGVIVGKPAEPALAIVVTGRSSDGATHVMRGIVSPDGLVDRVAFEPAPLPIVVGVGDLDGDGTDELVMVGDTRLAATRVVGAELVDIAGPTLAAKCHADVRLGHQQRPDVKHPPLRLVIESYDDAAGCMRPGNHYFELVGDSFIER